MEEQEVYRAVSVDPDDPGYVGERLAASALVRLAGEPPRARPHVTGGAAPGMPGYVGSAGDGRLQACAGGARHVAVPFEPR